MKKNCVGFCFHGASSPHAKLPFEWDKQPIEQVLNTRQEGKDSSGLFGNPDLKSHTLGAPGSPSQGPPPGGDFLPPSFKTRSCPRSCWFRIRRNLLLSSRGLPAGPLEGRRAVGRAEPESPSERSHWGLENGRACFPGLSRWSHGRPGVTLCPHIFSPSTNKWTRRGLLSEVGSGGLGGPRVTGQPELP